MDHVKEAESVTISKKEYERLQNDSRFLSALHFNGVDNWEWYSDAYCEAFPDEDAED